MLQMNINSEKILKVSNISLLLVLIVFNFLNFLDKFTTYFAMRLGFMEISDSAFYYFSTYGILQGVLIRFFVVMICSILIYFALTKSLKFLSVRIPILLGYIYVTINYLLGVISNVYYLVRY